MVGYVKAEFEPSTMFKKVLNLKAKEGLHMGDYPRYEDHTMTLINYEETEEESEENEDDL